MVEQSLALKVNKIKVNMKSVLKLVRLSLICHIISILKLTILYKKQLKYFILVIKYFC